MDAGSFPAEAISKLLLRRTSNPSFQLLAASATLDASTKRKLDRLVRSSPALRAAKRAGTMPVISVKGGGGGADAPAAKAAAVAAASRRVASGEGEEGRERLTLVPPGIEHRVFVLSGVKDGVKDGVKVYVKGGVKGGVNAAAKAARATTGGSIGGGANGAKAKVGGGGNGGGGTAAGTASAAAACVALHASCGGSALVFVSSRSAYLGGAHAVAVELRRWALGCTGGGGLFGGWNTARSRIQVGGAVKAWARRPGVPSGREYRKGGWACKWRLWVRGSPLAEEREEHSGTWMSPAAMPPTLLPLATFPPFGIADRLQARRRCPHPVGRPLLPTSAHPLLYSQAWRRRPHPLGRPLPRHHSRRQASPAITAGRRRSSSR
jgi:hypothetical protein